MATVKKNVTLQEETETAVKRYMQAEGTTNFSKTLDTLVKRALSEVN